MAKSKETPATSQPNLDPAGSKIEAIKNLIFGENIAQYDSEFDQLKKNIQKRHDELESLIDDINKSLNDKLDNVATDLGIRVSDLESKLEDRMDKMEDEHINRQKLGHLLVELGNKIAN